MAEEKIEMTQAEYDELDRRYRHLLDVERPTIIEALAAARAQGDLSENADYDAARNRQAEIEAEIAKIEAIKDKIHIVSVKGGDKVSVGYLVTYKTTSGETKTVRMVSSVNANPLGNPPAISADCALGKALIGHSVGDTVTVEAPRKNYDVTIVNLEA